LIHKNFINHIQSLRGISVLLVFLFHLNIEFFSNGYLGVDIFFVISGYIITGKIYSDYKKNGKILIINFYSRRIKRIFPNLIFITVFTYILFLIIGQPSTSLFNETFASITGISNLYFLLTTPGYFEKVLQNPLSHTWSLGVEMQFYFIYPFIFFLFLKNYKKKVDFIIALLAIFSLSLICYYLTLLYGYNSAAFYLSPLRFWEFIFGGLIFFCENKIKKNQFISLTSIITIFIIIFSKNLIIDFYKNLLIIFFSGTFIIFNNVQFFRNNKPLIALGNISYSFYLWHLPIIYFFNLYFNLYSDYIKNITIFFITLILSLFTFKYIENFFRNYNLKKKYIYLLLIILFIICVGFIWLKNSKTKIRSNLMNSIYAINYLNKNYNWNNRMIFEKILLSNNKIYDYCTDQSKNYNLNINGLKNECLKHHNYNTLFYIEGDSVTAQYVTPFNNLEIVKNIYFKFNNSNKISIDEINKLSNKYKNIIYVTDLYKDEKLQMLREHFKKTNNNISLLIFNSTPRLEEKYRDLPIKCFIQKKECFIDKESDWKKRNLQKLSASLIGMQNEYPNKVKIFDSYNSICPTFQCKIYDKEKDIIYYVDDLHYTIEGANELKDDLMKFIISNYSSILRD
jgi:peptidoglycan/LPS O-acetylase OafA/YrhL